MGDIDNQLGYAMLLSDSQKERTDDLATGYNKDDKVWELIIKHDSNIVWPDYVMQVNQLNAGYSTVKIKQQYIDELSDYKGIHYIEKPKRLYFDRNKINKSYTNVISNGLIINNSGVDGHGTIVAVIDSGIDYSHFVFRDKDGQTKLLGLWDQTTTYRGENAEKWLEVTGKLPGPPSGYSNGILYPREWINYVLEQRVQQRSSLLPQEDFSGHGTAVCGIASEIAPMADILFVKLGQDTGDSFPKTTRLMEAINWVIDVAVELDRPIAINLSFGNNYGPHDGRSLLERFIDDVSLIGRNNIIIGTGNEGDRRLHFETLLPKTYSFVTRAEFVISHNQRTFNIQIWKKYFDDVEIELELPNGNVYPIKGSSFTKRTKEENVTKITYNEMTIYAFVSPPTPYNELEEIYFEFILGEEQLFLQGGRYSINITSLGIVDGRVDMWMPSGDVVERDTGFLFPSPDTTLTIPSTAANAISVGAINSHNFTAAQYSGRGFLINGLIKPDVAAPGTDILAPAPGGGYSLNTGTSMAAPFITGCTSLLMQWGIVDRNDVFLYGQKLKAVLLSVANRQDVAPFIFPNTQTGWGIYEDF